MGTLHGMVVNVDNPVWDFHWLCTMMKKRSRVSLKGQQGIINGIRPEDGSGRCWLVTLTENGKSETVFVRTA